MGKAEDAVKKDGKVGRCKGRCSAVQSYRTATCSRYDCVPNGKSNEFHGEGWEVHDMRHVLTA